MGVRTTGYVRLMDFRQNLLGLLRGLADAMRSLLMRYPLPIAVAASVAASGLVAHLALHLSPIRAAYETARIFFDSADTSVDATATAPAWAWVVLWADRFLAPLVMAGAFLEIAHRIGRQGSVRPWWRGHVVIVGAGGLGSALARHHVRSGRRVVVIELDGDSPNLPGLRSAGVAVVEGDVRQADTLKRARVERASEITAVTGDDIANVAALLHAARCHPGKLRAHAHVSDADLYERLAPVLAGRFAGRQPLFNGFEVAATDLVSRRKLAFGPGPVLLVVAGYGNFGRAVVDAALRLHGDHPALSLWIVDPRVSALTPATEAWSAAHPGALHLEPTPMLDHALWDRIRAATGPSATLDFAICTDNDAKNLAFALAMQAMPGVGRVHIRMVARMLDWTDEEREAFPGISVVSLRDLVVAGLCH